MDWWNDLWLNEGFASFMQNVGVNHVYPEWKMMDQFFIDKFQVSTALDQLTNSHPIMAEVKDPAQINSLFDSISYDKVSENPQSLGCWNDSFTVVVHALCSCANHKSESTGISCRILFCCVGEPIKWEMNNVQIAKLRELSGSGLTCQLMFFIYDWNIISAVFVQCTCICWIALCSFQSANFRKNVGFFYFQLVSHT